MKCSLIISEDANGNLSVPVIDRDKNAVLAMLPEILREGVTAHYVKNPTARTFRHKARLKAEPITVEVEPEDDGEDPADALSDAPRRRGRPPKV